MPQAQQLMGWRFLKGVGVAVNNDKAMLWLQRAADSGLAPARTLLGIQLLGGGASTIKPNLVSGVYRIREAAEQGYAPAQQLMGNLYDSGTGVPQDFEMARDWWRKSAEQGDANAKFYLGRSLIAQGVPEQLPEALAWIKAAADQGDVDAKAWMDETAEDALGQKKYSQIKTAASHENNRAKGRPSPNSALLQLWDSSLQNEASRKAQAVQLQPFSALMNSPLAQLFGGSGPNMQAHLDASQDLYTVLDVRYVNGYAQADQYVVLADVKFRHLHTTGQAQVQGVFRQTEQGWILLSNGINDEALGLGLPHMSGVAPDMHASDTTESADDGFMDGLFFGAMWGD